MTAQCMAALMLSCAAVSLPPQAGGNSSLPLLPLSSSRSKTKSNSGSGMTVLLWQQLEQSGFLQKLPALLSLQASHLQQPADQLGDVAELPHHTTHLLSF